MPVEQPRPLLGVNTWQLVSAMQVVYGDRINPSTIVDELAGFGAIVLTGVDRYRLVPDHYTHWWTVRFGADYFERLFAD